LKNLATGPVFVNRPYHSLAYQRNERVFIYGALQEPVAQKSVARDQAVARDEVALE